MILKLGVQHRVIEYYQIPSNDDPMLTFDLFFYAKVTFDLFYTKVNFGSLYIYMENA